jgi:hypothetical protein
MRVGDVVSPDHQSRFEAGTVIRKRRGFTMVYRYDRNERRTVKCLAIIFLPIICIIAAGLWRAL